MLLASACVLLAFLTYDAYAISNDEQVQQHYGELIVAYYRSGFADQSLFHYENLYLYGGLFDVAGGSRQASAAVPRSLRDPAYPLRADRHRRHRARPGPPRGWWRERAPAPSPAFALAVCGPWYGAMFNHTKDIPFAAAMMGATYFLLRVARDLPRAALRATSSASACCSAPRSASACSGCCWSAMPASPS